MRARQYKEKLRIGDVLRTHPKDSFWGLAIVLATWPQDEDMGPMCHIGITDLVRRHEFEWPEAEIAESQILEFDQKFRTTPDDDRIVRKVCIGQYANFGAIPLPVIGRTDHMSWWLPKLTTEVGNGADGKYPLCGRIATHLGMEAIISWRRVHDASALALEERKSDEEHFRLMDELKMRY